MKLGEFIEKYIEKNCLIRLVHKCKGGHKIALDNWDDVSMEWEVIKGKGKNRHYINNKVFGITSIATRGAYAESINIVIEEMETQPFIEEVIEDETCHMESTCE
jgi:hypothetical protein